MISSLYYALNKYFKSCDILQIRCPTFLYIFLHKFSRNYIVSRMKRIFKEGKAIDSNRSATAVLMLECIVSEQNPDFCCIYGKHCVSVKFFCL